MLDDLQKFLFRLSLQLPLIVNVRVYYVCIDTAINMHRAVMSLMMVAMLVTLQLFEVSSLPPDFFRVGCVVQRFNRRHLGLTSSANGTAFLFLLSLSVLSHVFGAVDKTSSLVFKRTVK